MRPLSRLASAGLLFCLAGCTAPPVTGVCPVRPNPTPEEREADQQACLREDPCGDWSEIFLFNDVDVLLVVDNSPGMAPKQRALAAALPRLVAALDRLDANYHIGVATSDVGTYVAPGQPWSMSLGACDSFEGDDGTMQRVPCSARTGLSAEAVAACASLCPDPSFVPAGGQGFVSKVNGVTNVPADRSGAMGRDLGPERALQCLAFVGDAGCRIEGQMEGAKRALDGHNPMNKDFLRPGSTLVVIFVTDEDDCSVAPTRRGENDPVTMDCAAGDKDAAAGCFDPDYRCLARDVVCNEPLNTPGEKTGCQERSNSYLEKVDTYYRFFSALRPESKLLIAGLWTQPRLDGGGRLVISRRPGTTTSAGLERAGGADAGCRSADGAVTGAPQLRLSRLAKQLTGSLEASVCDVDGYEAAIDAIGREIKIKQSLACLFTVPRIVDGAPACVVGDVTQKRYCVPPPVAFPVCSARCCAGWAKAAAPIADDPKVQLACDAEAATPCYCALPSEAGACQGGAVLGVWRKEPAPPDTFVSAQCAGE